MKWSEVFSLSPYVDHPKRGHAAYVVALPKPPCRDVLRNSDTVGAQDQVSQPTGKTTGSSRASARPQQTALDQLSNVSDWRLQLICAVPGVSALAAMGFDPIVADLLLGHQPGKLTAVARVDQLQRLRGERKAA